MMRMSMMNSAAMKNRSTLIPYFEIPENNTLMALKKKDEIEDSNQ